MRHKGVLETLDSSQGWRMLTCNTPEGRFIFGNNIYNMSQFINYLKDTLAELKHVSWPTRAQTIVYTVLVVVVSLLTALFLGAFDFGFSRGLNWFIQ